MLKTFALMCILGYEGVFEECCKKVSIYFEFFVNSRGINGNVA